ncbi:MAG: hypothetical protein RLZZ385_407 [Pseudomonadota bacterium]
MSHAPPLSGITVLALEHAIAAPLCTRQLADLGARVIKIERRGNGDFARHYDHRAKGLSSHFVWTNRGKQSLCLDLKHPAARDILQRLLLTTDVLVQNLAPGAAARLGMDYAALATQHPRLIVCDISGYGNGGPYDKRKAYDLLVQSEAGFLSITGTPEQPVKAGISVADIAAGMQAHSAILAALLQRGRTGAGSHVEVSLLEAMVEWMGYPLYYALDGASPPPRSGADHATIYPYGVFRTGAGESLLIGLQNDREWQEFSATVLEKPQLASDPRFSSNSLRSAARDMLRDIIESAFADLDTDALIRRLDNAGIAWARVNDLAAVWAHPQLAALQRQVQIGTPAGPLPAFRPPGNNNSYRAVMGEVPDVGEHTEAILAELGFSPEQIQQLQQDCVI